MENHLIVWEKKKTQQYSISKIYKLDSIELGSLQYLDFSS